MGLKEQKRPDVFPTSAVLVLTLSRGRSPWRGKPLRRGWPSARCPGGPSCTVCRAISAHAGDCGASWQYADHDTFLKEQQSQSTKHIRVLVLFDVQVLLGCISVLVLDNKAFQSNRIWNFRCDATNSRRSNGPDRGRGAAQTNFSQGGTATAHTGPLTSLSAEPCFSGVL